MLELRESDFRSFHPRLVHVLPGREAEAVQYAHTLFALGKCDGIFVQNKDIKDWGFLARADGFDTYVFANIDATFNRIDHGFLRAARRLSISEIRCALDLPGFPGLRGLCLWWSPRAKGLERLEVLRDISLWGVNKASNACCLDLPESIRHIQLVRYGHPTLSLGTRVVHLNELNIHQARALQSLPPLDEVRSIDLSFVGSQTFDYASIPDSVEFLQIHACAPISSLGFLSGKTKLKFLSITRTACPKPSAEERALLDRIPSVDMSHYESRNTDISNRNTDISADWRAIVSGREWFTPSPE